VNLNPGGFLSFFSGSGNNVHDFPIVTGSSYAPQNSGFSFLEMKKGKLLNFFGTTVMAINIL
jgi:hypothetical protein